MFYFNKISKQFGVTFQDACATTQASIPAGTVSFGDWEGYVFSEQPAYSHITHRLVEALPKQVGSVLTQQWVIQSLAAESIAANEASYRQMLYAQIQAWRDQQENGGVEHNGHRWDTDEAARGRILAVLLTGANPLGYWTSEDNVNVPMTFAELQALWVAIVQRGAQIHARQREMKHTVVNLTGVALEGFVIGM